PLSVQPFSGSEAQCTDLSLGIRTRLTSGCQSPSIPSTATGRIFNGPNADGPSNFIGSSTAYTVFESCSVKLPSLKLKKTRNDSSAVATSIFSVDGKASGASVLRKKFSFPSWGTSSGLPSRTTGDASASSSCTLLLKIVTFGRGDSTAA